MTLYADKHVAGLSDGRAQLESALDFASRVRRLMHANMHLVRPVAFLRFNVARRYELLC